MNTVLNSTQILITFLFCFVAHYCLYFCSRRYIYCFTFYLCCFGGGGVGVSFTFSVMCVKPILYWSIQLFGTVWSCKPVLAEFSECERFFFSHGVTVKPEIIFFTELSFAVFSWIFLYNLLLFCFFGWLRTLCVNKIIIIKKLKNDMRFWFITTEASIDLPRNCSHQPVKWLNNGADL